MPPESRSTYHHGALREELITASIALIENEGIGAVSIRRVAREAGVSPGAPYHHFADRAALLNVIAARGYLLLLTELRRAHDEAGSPVEAVGALVEAYVRFARSNKAYIQLTHRPELSHAYRDPTIRALAKESLRLLTDAVIECQRAGSAPPGDPAPLVTMVWSMAAGLAMLSIDGPLERLTAGRGSTIEALTDQVSRLFQSLLDGVSPREHGRAAGPRTAVRVPATGRA